MDERDRKLAAPPRTVTAVSSDQVLTFQLSARMGGISVQRSERQIDGRRLVQSVRFDDEAAFVRWCQADKLWFTYPLLFSNLARSGCELFVAPP